MTGKGVYLQRQREISGGTLVSATSSQSSGLKAKFCNHPLTEEYLPLKWMDDYIFTKVLCKGEAQGMGLLICSRKKKIQIQGPRWAALDHGLSRGAELQTSRGPLPTSAMLWSRKSFPFLILKFIGYVTEKRESSFDSSSHLCRGGKTVC